MGDWLYKRYDKHPEIWRFRGGQGEKSAIWASLLPMLTCFVLVLVCARLGRLVTIAQIEGRVRGIGSEFVLACDMRFAARESAVFGQFEPSFGVIPGTGGVQHLTRLMGLARALEVMLSAEDYNADLAERYGWINRALPAGELSEFVRLLALRIASFPAAGHVTIKDRVNAIALAPAEEFRLK